MIYWIIQIILAILIAVTIIITVVNIVKEKNAYKRYEMEDMYGSENEEENRPVRRSKKQVSPQNREPSPRSAAVSKKNNGGNRRRWKVILQDMDTEERYDFIFFDSIGMGRTTQEAAYEEFLSLPDDRKVSKVHCAIVRSNDKLFLRDEGSRNHTYLNGKKITNPIVLQKEDVISLGETDLEILKILRESSQS